MPEQPLSESNRDTELFSYGGRYDTDLRHSVRREEWERYWRHLDSISVAEVSELYSLFVTDSFQGGLIIVESFDLSKGELLLSIENTACMNKIHEARGDEWACAHIQRSDFATRVTFSGVDSMDLELGTVPWCRYYRFSEVIGRGDALQMTIALTGEDDDLCYLRFGFQSMTAEDISDALKKYALAQ